MSKGVESIRKFFSRRDVDMTRGNVYGLLIEFAVPLLLGNLFQQLYNTVDTWVVGNYVGKEAFSAVGTVNPIINMLIGFFMGLSVGAGVVISQYYGAKQTDKVSDTVHTALVMTGVLGVLFTAIGVSMTPLMLKFMKTPAEVLPEAKRYLTIYFSGIFGLMLYNIGAGILRAVGDSQRPFYFLVLSASLNIVLDLLFVLAFHMGVAGVAYATILSQGISALLVLFVLLRSDNCCRVQVRKLKMHWDVLKKIVKVGIPAAIQMAITAFSNVFVQSYINYFGADCMGGWTAYTKIDAFLFLPMQRRTAGPAGGERRPADIGPHHRGPHGAGGSLRPPSRALLQRHAGGGRVWDPVPSDDVPLLRALLREPDFGRVPARCGGQPDAHVHHAGEFRGVPADISLLHHPLRVQHHRAGGPGVSGGLAGVQHRHLSLLPLRPLGEAPGGRMTDTFL